VRFIPARILHRLGMDLTNYGKPEPATEKEPCASASNAPVATGFSMQGCRFAAVVRADVNELQHWSVAP